MLEITIIGGPKEIAALVLEIQERQEYAVMRPTELLKEMELAAKEKGIDWDSLT